MKIIIPYLNTRIETDIMLTLVLTPLWWVLGFNIFIYHATVLLVFIKLLLLSSHYDHPIMMPKGLIYLGIHIVFYALSIIINIGNHPIQRIFASINNLLFIILGFLMVLVLYNIDFESVLRSFGRTSRTLCLVSGVLGFVYVGMWFMGYKNVFIPSLLARLAPSLLSYPYFYALMFIGINKTEWLVTEVPRLTLYSGPPTATGGFMLIVIPLMMLYYHLYRKKRLEYFFATVFSLCPLLFSVSRAAIVAFAGAWIFVTVLSKGKKLFFVLLCCAAMMLLSGLLLNVVQWLLHFREASTESRVDLYQQALQIVWENNIFLGMGARIRQGFTMQAIGSHSLYIELLFVTGIIGLSLFIIFQLHVLKTWYFQQKWIRTERDMLIWKYLGIGILSLDLWLITDTLLAIPLIAYGYFMVVTCIYAFDRGLKLRADQEMDPVERDWPATA